MHYWIIPIGLNDCFVKRDGDPSPDLFTQRKIAAILSAYDDLIENNLRRIKILEEMAQNLYREWFVKFRFPGHQHTRFTDSPLGRIPEGWEVKAVENTFDILGGGTPSKVVPGIGVKELSIGIHQPILPQQDQCSWNIPAIKSANWV